MASSRGMFTSTFLKVSKISLSTSSIFLVGIILGGNGRGMGGCYKSPLIEGALEEDQPFPKGIFLFVFTTGSRRGDHKFIFKNI